jgi:hypothetical protein
MFITYRRAEIAYPQMFGDEFQMWRWVELEEHRPWFYVMVNHPQKATPWRTMLLIPSEVELESMLEKRTAGTLIEAVQVVLPARLNGSADWTMERLIELVRVYDGNQRILGYDFTTASGHTYSHRECQYALDVAKHQVYCSSMT